MAIFGRKNLGEISKAELRYLDVQLKKDINFQGFNRRKRSEVRQKIIKNFLAKRAAGEIQPLPEHERKIKLVADRLGEIAIAASVKVSYGASELTSRFQNIIFHKEEKIETPQLKKNVAVRIGATALAGMIAAGVVVPAVSVATQDHTVSAQETVRSDDIDVVEAAVSRDVVIEQAAASVKPDAALQKVLASPTVSQITKNTLTDPSLQKRFEDVISSVDAQATLEKVEDNLAIYEAGNVKADGSPTGVPIEFIQAIAFREGNGNVTENPPNGQGIWQMADGARETQFTPGPISREEAVRQTQIMVQDKLLNGKLPVAIKWLNDHGYDNVPEVDVNDANSVAAAFGDDRVLGLTMALYNGLGGDLYAEQASSLGLDRWMTPYTYNRMTPETDGKNATAQWFQIIHDYGKVRQADADTTITWGKEAGQVVSAGQFAEYWKDSNGNQQVTRATVNDQPGALMIYADLSAKHIQDNLPAMQDQLVQEAKDAAAIDYDEQDNSQSEEKTANTSEEVAEQKTIETPEEQVAREAAEAQAAAEKAEADRIAAQQAEAERIAQAEAAWSVKWDAKLAEVAARVNSGEIHGSSVGMEIPAGARALRTETAEYFGNTYDIQLVAISGVPSSDNPSEPGNEYYIDGANGELVVNVAYAPVALATKEWLEIHGLTMTTTSGYRNVEYQQHLRDADPSNASPPGRSEHNDGTAIDIQLPGGNRAQNNTADASGRKIAPNDAVWNSIQDMLAKDPNMAAAMKINNGEVWHYGANAYNSARQRIG